MTQSQTQNQNLTEGLNRIRRWRDQYRSMQPPSPLEDVNQLAAKLEMTHAHPSGIAQLFASGHVRLDSLFRDTGVLKAAERHIGACWMTRPPNAGFPAWRSWSLVVGVATWKGNALPVLLYPVSVTIEDDGLSTTIRFTGRVALNVAFVNTLREQGVFLDEDPCLTVPAMTVALPKLPRCSPVFRPKRRSVSPTSPSSARLCSDASWTPRRR